MGAPPTYSTVVDQAMAEVIRLARLNQLNVLDSAPEALFDTVTRLAAEICGMPISLISLVDKERQWFKSTYGLEGVSETARDISFCAHAIEHGGVFEINDATQDPRFADNELVTGPLGFRFYAGAPITLRDGARPGTLCVIDQTPRQLTDSQRHILQCLAQIVSDCLQERERCVSLSRDLMDSEDRYRAIVDFSSDAIISKSLDGIIHHWNLAAEKLFGYTAQEAVGQHISMLFPTDGVQEECMLIRHVLQHGSISQFETVRLHKDGRRLDVAITLSAIRDAHGRVIGVSKIARDVGERKRLDQELNRSLTRHQMLYHIAPAMMHTMDAEARLITVSDTWLAHMGYAREEVIGRHTWEFLTPASRIKAREQVIPGLFENGRCDDVHYQYQRKDGGVIDVLLSARLERDVEGKAWHSLAIMQDVTEKKRFERELAEQNERLRVTLQCIGDGVITTDVDGKICYMNPVAERLTGWSNGDAIGQHLSQLFKLTAEHSKPYALPGVPREGTVLIARDGAEYDIEENMAPLLNDQQESIGMVLVFRDVTRQRQMTSEMTYRAAHDPLTGLLNRGEFDMRLHRALHEAKAGEGEHVALYIDLDQFKVVNDACGHSVGDQLLRQVSSMLQSCVRTTDTLARLGGDEFGVILQYCAVDKALRIAEQMVELIDQFRFMHDEQRFRIGASIGLVRVDASWASAAAVIHAADTACYTAKEAGRNRVQMWLESDESLHSRQVETHWAARLEQAIDEDHFELYAQRLTPLSTPTGALYCEVLLRLREPDGSIVPPGAFLPAAERFHMASRIDRWVVRKVCEAMASADLSLVDTLSVNLSGQSIGDRAFHRFVVDYLDRNQVDTSKLCFEITETTAITNMREANDFIAAMQARGIRFALDDFGSGAASFGYLKSLAVDVLKIDGQFIKELASDAVDQATVRCIREIASAVGKATVAEFVETAETASMLRDMGIDYAQGYLYHRPEPLGQLLR
ncbi:PAS domain S-box protein [Amantichitinum ursilacus]|nr:PAS domain S-box protein [Amantichitinum ursilacus]